MPIMIIKDGKVVEVLPNTDTVKDLTFNEETIEIYHTLVSLGGAMSVLDERIANDANKPWYVKQWDKVLRSRWYHGFWNRFQSWER